MIVLRDKLYAEGNKNNISNDQQEIERDGLEFKAEAERELQKRAYMEYVNTIIDAVDNKKNYDNSICNEHMS